jgi:hypothetical protein
MAAVASYSLLFYGSPEGYQTNRAQIQLSDAGGQTLAWIRFEPPRVWWRLLRLGGWSHAEQQVPT